MGWWREEEQGKELIIGDEPLDVAGNMLSCIVDTYRRDVGRKPTVEEIAKTLQFTLYAATDQLFDGMAGKDIAGVTIRLRNRPRRCSVTLGDVFAIPLPNKGYAYGRVRDKIGRAAIRFDQLGFYSESLPGLRQLSVAPVLRDWITDPFSLEDRSWPILGNIPPDVSPAARSPEGDEQELSKQMSRFGGFSGSEPIVEEIDEELRRTGYIP